VSYELYSSRRIGSRDRRGGRSPVLRALIRLAANREQRPIGLPEKFLPIAEQWRLIVPIGPMGARRSVCPPKQPKKGWLDAGPWRPTCRWRSNLSAGGICDPTASFKGARCALHETGIGMRRVLEFELPPNRPFMARTQIHDAQCCMRSRLLGGALTLDDFGDGGFQLKAI